ncbi:Nuclear import receptor [Xylographa soralifera]|nr:Nuclear import receptor [Xylographa soralifera]
MAADGFAPVLAALTTMQSSVDQARKLQAHTFLEAFQKSPEAWTSTHTILSSPDVPLEAKLFAATTLKGKIIYDLDQIPRSSLPPLRDSLLSVLSEFRGGPRPIRTQLCVCLANLAIQMTEWKDVLSYVGSRLGSSAGDCILEFLQVLPEEVTEGRKINLTEEDLIFRTKELLEDNAPHVMTLLVQYSESSPSAATNPRLLECMTSWLREIPSADIVQSSLLDVIVNGLSSDTAFEASVDCMCAIYRDTKEVDESFETIQILYPRIVALQPKIAEAADLQDTDALKGITRLFAEAGEAWVVMIARLPDEFRGLVEAILECCARDQDREAISLTFLFWTEFKQMITVERYQRARTKFGNVFADLVDIMIKHLEFPTPEGSNETDLFGGDRGQEEKFREFRHAMGDVLKDCCEVITVTECLGKAFNLIKDWVSIYASESTASHVPHWQQLEAPLFAMRAMGRMVSPEESVVMHQLIPLIVQIPDHDKLRFQAIMALGRYTEWTAQHPEFLEQQLNFVIAGFDHPSGEVVRASALAFRFFGTDCRKLLKDHCVPLHGFYESILDKLPQVSQDELTEGVSYVVSAQPPERIYEALKLYCDPIVERLKIRANSAKIEQGEEGLLALSDTLILLNIFINNVQPYYAPTEENQAVKYCQEILPVLSAVANNFTDNVNILERICKCWRTMIFSYRTAVFPLLGDLANQLAKGFQDSHAGCFLWVTDAILREFADGQDFVEPGTTEAIYTFFEQQAIAFLRIMDQMSPRDIPDVIEDFFRLLVDALIYYNHQFIPAAICGPTLSAAIASLVLQQQGPLIVTLHYLRDLLSYGTDRPASSHFGDTSNTARQASAAELQKLVKDLVVAQGEALVQLTLAGMMFTFPRDCLQDASGVLIALFELMPQQTASWFGGTIAKLPAGSVKAGEADRIMNNIAAKIQAGDLRKLRAVLQGTATTAPYISLPNSHLIDFTVSYRRRNVAPRDGLLGGPEPARFKYKG